MFKRQLKCSFCGKSQDQVAKLVAGPRVFICDECTAIVVRIINEDETSVGKRPERRKVLESIRRLLQRIWRMSLLLLGPDGQHARPSDLGIDADNACPE